jgi:hypothetical protein
MNDKIEKEIKALTNIKEFGQILEDGMNIPTTDEYAGRYAIIKMGRGCSGILPVGRYTVSIVKPGETYREASEYINRGPYNRLYLIKITKNIIVECITAGKPRLEEAIIVVNRRIEMYLL